MINNITSSNPAYFDGPLLQKNVNDSGVQSPQQTPPIAPVRIIQDKIEISPQAKQTYEQHQKTQKQAQDILTDEVMEKGFLAWAQEKQMEKIEAEARAQVLKSMGLDEDDFSNLESEVKQRIEMIIAEKVREKLELEIAKNLKKSNPNADISL